MGVPTGGRGSMASVSKPATFVIGSLGVEPPAGSRSRAADQGIS